MSTRSALAVLSLTLAACAAAVPPAPAPEPVPYRLELRFESRVPEPYPVLSGPAESYERLPVNGRLAGLLAQRLAARSAPGATEAAEVAVTLREVSTSYRALGAAEPTGDDRLAALGRPPHTTVAEFLLGEGDSWAPAEIHKGVWVRLRATVRAGGAVRGEKEIEAEARETVLRQDFDRWAYDYGPLVDRALAAAADGVDALVTEALGGRGR
ncbi:MAG: hypothetical protein ACYDA8_15075 [Deferrisomatales bacterium]